MLNDLKVGLSLASSTIKRGNKKTLIFTIFVLALIFVNLIFMPAMIYGMEDIFVGMVRDYTYGNIIIEPSEDEIYIEKADLLLRKINNINGITAASKRLSSGATLSHEQEQVGANILGIDPEEEKMISKFHEIVREGEFLSKLSRDEIMLGAFLAGKEEGPEIYDDLGGVTVGTLITVTFSNGVSREYKVRGIHEAGPEVADMMALVHYKELEDVLGIQGEDKATSIVIKIDKIGEEQEIKQKLIDVGIKEDIFTWQEKVLDIIRDMLKSFTTLTLVSRIVSVVIAVFVLFIIIYINTLHRRKQIGILKAIGITPSSIIFSYMILSLFFVLLGILFGAFLLFIIVMYFTANPIQFFETMMLTPKVGSAFVIQGVISLVLTSIVAGYIPAWLVTREPILKAIWGR